MSPLSPVIHMSQSGILYKKFDPKTVAPEKLGYDPLSGRSYNFANGGFDVEEKPSAFKKLSKIFKKTS